MSRSAESGQSSTRAIKRCAIYTRKSSEEGLEQDFNSLDAQREACAAYIQSQQHEGWVAIPTVYDDGGKSGGTLERPALQRLLAEIAQRRVDVIVVYKVDRLTRSLADFAKLVDVFDAHQVSFVSITQQFNTTTSMGRLTLNVLLSFAQFEREVTAERIRDKIAASKRKGLWMGGRPPLGYDIHERTLVINDTEAVTVRHIFARYLALKSVALLKAELDAAGIVSKMYAGRSGPACGGTPMQRGALYKLLSNPIYRGRIRHKALTFPGQHPALIDEALWEGVQAQLTDNRNEHTLRPHARQPSLLTGCLYDGEGQRLTPTHATKQGRRYRYYISQPLTTGIGIERAHANLRLPAAEIEKLITARIRHCLSDHAFLYPLIASIESSASALNAILAEADTLAHRWDDLPSLRRRTIVRTLLHRVVVTRDEVTLQLAPEGFRKILNGGQSESDNSSPSLPSPITLTFPARLRMANGGLRLVMEGHAASDLTPDLKLVKLLCTAHAFKRHLTAASEEATMERVAAAAGVSSSYFTRVLRLAWLAPDLTVALMEGRHPPELNALQLLKLSSRLPVDWPGQRRLLNVNEAARAR